MKTWLGIVGAIVASLCFGSNYVPVKRYPTYDGLVFQWFQCSGILIVGLIVGISTNDWRSQINTREEGLYVSYWGIIGGFLWSFANILATPVVKYLGLGFGFVLWNSCNILMAWSVARFELFNISDEASQHHTVNLLGIIMIIFALVLLLSIYPNVGKIDQKLQNITNAINQAQIDQHNQNYDNNNENNDENNNENNPNNDINYNNDNNENIMRKDNENLINQTSGLVEHKHIQSIHSKKRKLSSKAKKTNLEQPLLIPNNVQIQNQSINTKLPNQQQIQTQESNQSNSFDQLIQDNTKQNTSHDPRYSRLKRRSQTSNDNNININENKNKNNNNQKIKENNRIITSSNDDTSSSSLSQSVQTSHTTSDSNENENENENKITTNGTINNNQSRHGDLDGINISDNSYDSNNSSDEYNSKYQNNYNEFKSYVNISTKRAIHATQFKRGRTHSVEYLPSLLTDRYNSSKEHNKSKRNNNNKSIKNREIRRVDRIIGDSSSMHVTIGDSTQHTNDINTVTTNKPKEKPHKFLSRRYNRPAVLIVTKQDDISSQVVNVQPDDDYIEYAYDDYYYESDDATDSNQMDDYSRINKASLSQTYGVAAGFAPPGNIRNRNDNGYRNKTRIKQNYDKIDETKEMDDYSENENINDNNGNINRIRKHKIKRKFITREPEATFTNPCSNALDFGVVARQIMLERWERQQALRRQMELQIQQEIMLEQEQARLQATLERKKRQSKLLCYCLPYKFVGFMLCIIMGLCVGNALTPYLIWKTKYKKNNNGGSPNALDFMFSQTIGIYLFSTIIFLYKGLYSRLKHDKLKRPVMRPAIVSGILWAIGFGGQLFAVTYLPYSVGYPICAIGPVLISTLWSLVVFREIQGRHNISVLTVSIIFSVLGILMLALSVTDAD